MIVQLRTANYDSSVSDYLPKSYYTKTTVYTDGDDESSYSKEICISRFHNFDELISKIDYDRILIDTVDNDFWDKHDDAEYMVTIADDYLS